MFSQIFTCCHSLQLLPPSIDYSLPSPPIGLPSQIVPDPPWMPLYKLKLEELAANQEGSVSRVRGCRNIERILGYTIHVACRNHWSQLPILEGSSNRKW